MTSARFFSRFKGILLSPRQEWANIAATSGSRAATRNYLLLLALLSGILNFLQFGVVGISYKDVHTPGSLAAGLRQGVLAFIVMLVSVYFSAYILNRLAPRYGAEKNFDNALQVVVYATSPGILAGIVYMVPYLSLLAVVFGIYSLYILYVGLNPVMKAPKERVTRYFIMYLLVSIVVVFVIVLAVSLLLGLVFGLLYAAGSAAF